MSEEKFTLNIFCCRAKKDQRFCETLDARLNALKRNVLQCEINIEHSHSIPAGAERERARKRRLNSADIILLMISPNFFGSDEHDYYNEALLALEFHKTGNARVAAILLHPTILDNIPFDDLIILPDKDHPISTSQSREKAYMQISNGVYSIINETIASSSFVNKKRGERFEELLNQGRQIKDDRPYRALEMFEDALQVYPEHARIAEAYYYIGEMLNKLKRYEEALEALGKSSSLGSDNAYLYINKGIALKALQRDDEAQAAYDEAVRLDPNTASALVYKGELHHQKNQYRAALLAYEDAVRLKPDEATVYYGLGKVLFVIPDTPEELMAYEEDRQLGSNDPLFYYEKALMAYGRAHQLGLNDPLFYKDYALAYSQVGDRFFHSDQYEKAQHAYFEATRLDPENALFYCSHGQALFCLGRDKEALAEYKEAIRLDPNYSSAYHHMGEALHSLSWKLEVRAQEAYAHARLLLAEAAIDANKDNPQAYYTKAEALRVLKREQEAAEMHEYARQLERLLKVLDALHQHPDDPAAYYHKGSILSLLKRYEEALEAFDEVIQRDQYYALAYYNKSDVLRVLNREQEATQVHAQARLLKAEGLLRLDPENAFAYYTKSEALRILNRLEESREAYSRAIQLGFEI